MNSEGSDTCSGCYLFFKPNEQRWPVEGKTYCAICAENHGLKQREPLGKALGDILRNAVADFFRKDKP